MPVVLDFDRWFPKIVRIAAWRERDSPNHCEINVLMEQDHTRQ